MKNFILTLAIPFIVLGAMTFFIWIVGCATGAILADSYGHPAFWILWIVFTIAMYSVAYENEMFKKDLN